MSLFTPLLDQLQAGVNSAMPAIMAVAAILSGLFALIFGVVVVVSVVRGVDPRDALDPLREFFRQSDPGPKKISKAVRDSYDKPRRDAIKAQHKAARDWLKSGDSL